MTILITKLLNGTSISKQINDMGTAYKISNIYFEQDNLILILDDQKYIFKLKDISDKLASANNNDRNNFLVSPSGYGIHWPNLDEDLSINGLLHLKKKYNVA
jgi:hypothetical protein